MRNRIQAWPRVDATNTLARVAQRSCSFRSLFAPLALAVAVADLRVLSMPALQVRFSAVDVACNVSSGAFNALLAFSLNDSTLRFEDLARIGH